MNKGAVSDIKPGMLVQIEVASGPDKGIVYNADTDIFTVLILDNSGENLPACIGADEIICAWNIAQLPTYIIGDMLQGRASGWISVLDQAVVYRATRPEAIEMTLEEISELASKQLGKPVSVSVKDSKPEEAKPKTDVFIVPEDGIIDHDAQIGEEFEIKGVRYRVIEDTRVSRSDCDGCALYDDFLCGRYGGACGELRDDGKTIIFERVPTEDTCKSSETAGEPTDKVIHVAEGGRFDRDAQIGEEFEIAGDVYRAVEDSSGYCLYCDLEEDDLCGRLGPCAAGWRSDGKGIVFKRISAQMADEQKTTIATEIHDLHDVEPAIGDVLEDSGKKLKVVECDSGCVGCYFCDDDIDSCKHIICAGRHRKDGKNIVLQEVEEKE